MLYSENTKTIIFIGHSIKTNLNSNYNLNFESTLNIKKFIFIWGCKIGENILQFVELFSNYKNYELLKENVISNNNSLSKDKFELLLEKHNSELNYNQSNNNNL